MRTSDEQNYKQAKTDSRPFSIEKFISISLRIGVVICLVLLLIGLFMLIVGEQRQLTYSNNLIDIWHSLIQGEGYAIIDLGLLVLILTPVFRVAASIVLFGHERDYFYSFITTFVLCILIISFLLGKIG